MSFSPKQPTNQKKEKKDTKDMPKLKSIVDTPHQFLKFSRKITEVVSTKRPVDIQLGIACGKNLLFAPSLGHHAATVKIEALLNQQNKLVGYSNSKLSDSPPTTPVSTPTHAYSISTISLDEPMEYAVAAAAPQHSFPNRSALLHRLVNDVLSHIESCPDQSNFSEDLIKLKPRLEAYNSQHET